MKEFEKIYEENIQHNSFLNKESVIKCMMDSYHLGKMDLLKWLSNKDYLSDNKEVLLEEYNNHINLKSNNE
jgi:hypothetical protein